jgi:hypothetical protein
MLELVKTQRERLAVKVCPCGAHSNKDGKFVPFVGYSDAGFCHSCGKTFYPDKKPIIKPVQIPRIQPITWISGGDVIKTLRHYHQNNFTRWLAKTLGQEALENALYYYPIGTSKKWPGATIFWTLDINVTPRRGSIMLYDETGHRVKKRNHSVHALMKKSAEKPPECFFGEHLLNYYPNKLIAIVESAKTAIIANHFLPEYIWLSCNGASGLTREKLTVLKDRKVYLYPDEDKVATWRKLADTFGDITEIHISQLTAKLGENRKGTDLADLLI